MVDTRFWILLITGNQANTVCIVHERDISCQEIRKYTVL